MSDKQLYACLIKFNNNETTGETVKVVTMQIASSDEEAKELALEDALRQHGAHLRRWRVGIDAHSVKRSKLEEAAREVLGWNAPA